MTGPRRRIPLLYVLLLVMVTVSVAPLALYHNRVLEISGMKLADHEQRLQTDTTRLLSEEIHLYRQHAGQQLQSLRRTLVLAGFAEDAASAKRSSQLRQVLEEHVARDPGVDYVTVLNREAKGVRAGNFQADEDPFVRKALERAFAAGTQRLESTSDPLNISRGGENHPAIVLAVPLFLPATPTGGHEDFRGIVAELISLDPIVDRLRDASHHGRVSYVVERNGHIVAHPDRRKYIAGQDVSGIGIVQKYLEMPIQLRATATAPFEIAENGQRVEMLGTYSPVRDLHWAVIAQRRLADAHADMGIRDMNQEAMHLVLIAIALSMMVSLLLARRITYPIHSLAEITRAISRGEFHRRVQLRSRTEIGELAENFNLMAHDIEDYIEQLKQAAQENRELFMGSIRMLSAAIDEKDPYTQGHSGRVAKYSVIIAEELGLTDAEVDQVRISALLHDVGKIGIDDRVLKKPGTLTPEEFQLMKQHPSKGANIMRPVPQLSEMIPGIELHHECFDGTGYPRRLVGTEIPLMARIISVADTLDAITTNRPYQTAYELDYALKMIGHLSGKRFDPNVVEAFARAVEKGAIKLNLALIEA